MKKWISSFISIAIFIGILCAVVFVYNKYYFNDFSKAHRMAGKTSFYRDSSVRYDKDSSYCIENKEFNDALFFKEIHVEKDTPYKITCMVKTENVESDNPETAGACISLMDSPDQSMPIQGTNDWQKVDLLVDSKNAESIKICFRLGGYDGVSKGKVWFSDIHVEQGYKDVSKDWNVACFLINNVETVLNGKQYIYSLTTEDKRLLKDNMKRFANTCKDFSEGLMTVSYDVIEIDEPLTNFSYDEENYYYAMPSDVKPLIDRYVKENEYDHIFIGIRMGNQAGGIPVNEWIGLGSMRYDSIGFSNIRMPNDLQHSTMYKYDIRNDIFPEEVFVHEFLHSLERNLQERNFVFPALHDNEKFGYKSQSKTGLKDWYKAYMQCDISSNVGKTGLDTVAYTTKPVQLSDFNSGKEIEFEMKPHNFIDAILQLFNNLKNIVGDKESSAGMLHANYVTVTSD